MTNEEFWRQREKITILLPNLENKVFCGWGALLFYKASTEIRASTHLLVLRLREYSEIVQMARGQLSHMRQLDAAVGCKRAVVNHDK